MIFLKLGLKQKSATLCATRLNFLVFNIETFCFRYIRMSNKTSLLAMLAFYNIFNGLTC